MEKEINIQSQIKNIKNECASCGNKFQNNLKYYLMAGNFCRDCCGKVKYKIQWQKLRKKEKLSLEEQKKFNYLTKILMTRWKIDMEEDYKEFQGFRDY